jgi:hypothetical protein
MKILLHAALIIGVIFICGCKKKPEENKVDFDQINVDKSSNYEFIFRDIIDEEKHNKAKYKKKEFE